MQAPFVLPALALLLAGCQPAYLDGAPNLSSPYYRPPAGSTLEILRAVTMPAGSDRLYFQDGRLRRWYEVNEYRAYCALVLEGEAGGVTAIAPGDYTVRAVSNRYLFRLARSNRPAAMRAVSLEGRDDSGEDYRVLALILDLEGPDPRVHALACANWGIPSGMPRVTVRSIRASLGEGFELRLAGR